MVTGYVMNGEFLGILVEVKDVAGQTNVAIQVEAF
jgi:hypothetical protein